VTWMGEVAPRPDVADWRHTALADLWDDERWRSTVERARSRYPANFTPSTVERLHLMHTEVPAAIDILRDGPVVFAHMDPHLDNTMWRRDGSPILLDWSNATVAPPTYDLAQLLIGLALDRNGALEPEMVIESYRVGSPFGQGLVASTRAAMRLFLRGMVGFMGKHDAPDAHPRLLRTRDRAAADLSAFLTWLDGDE